MEQTVAPTTTLCSLSEVKEWLGIVGTHLDDTLDELIEAASDLIEDETNVRWREQTWQQTHYQFANCILLEAYPVTEVNVTYYDVDNGEQTMSADNYLLFAKGKRQYLKIDVLPTTYYRPDAVTITMACQAPIPKLAKLCCRELVAHWERHREAVLSGAMRTVPHGYERSIELLRRGANIT